jgi:exportin-1
MLDINESYYEKVTLMFTSIMAATNTMIPPSTSKFKHYFLNLLASFFINMNIILDIAEVYENSNDDDQEFVQNLALFLTGYLSAHLKV